MHDLLAMNDFVGFTDGVVKYSTSKDSDSDSLDSLNSASFNDSYEVCKEKASEIIAKVKKGVSIKKQGHRFSIQASIKRHYASDNIEGQSRSSSVSMSSTGEKELNKDEPPRLLKGDVEKGNGHHEASSEKHTLQHGHHTKSHKIVDWFKRESSQWVHPAAHPEFNKQPHNHTFKWIQKLKAPSPQHHHGLELKGPIDDGFEKEVCGHFIEAPPGQSDDRTDTDCQLDGAIVDSHKSMVEKEELVSGLTIYHMEIRILRGQDLAVHDMGGSSDPYVKVKFGQTTVYRSKTIKSNLNPVWDETVTIPIESVREAKMEFLVYDYDKASSDDFMGAAICDCRDEPIGILQEHELELKEQGNANYLGKLYVTVLITPTILDEKDSRLISLRREAEKDVKHQIWKSTVTVIALEGKDFGPRIKTPAVAMDDLPATYTEIVGKDQKLALTESTKDNKIENDKIVQAPLNLFLKLAIGPEKGKTKISPLTLTPQWRERFQFHIYPDEEPNLSVAVYNKPLKKRSELLGKLIVDISKLEPDITNVVWKNLEEGPFEGAIKLMIVVSGCKVGETDATSTLPLTNTEDVKQRYSQSIWKSFTNLNHVGYLIVKVIEARNLAAVDMGGTSDPFCVLELGNTRLQTQTLYKTLSPEWNKTFVFDIHDIFINFEIHVMDENKNTKTKFLGKLVMPLLSIENGIKKWYQLKDESLKGEVKGEILLEMLITYNMVKACLVAFTPKEEKVLAEPPSFNTNVFIANVNRTKALVVDNIPDKLPNILNWENLRLTISVLVGYLLGVYYFHPCMIPLVFIGLFVRGYIMKKKQGFEITYQPELVEAEMVEEPSKEIEDVPKKESSKKSIKDTIQSIQDTCQSVQNVLDTIASYGERVKNIFNFTLPFLSYLAFTLLILAFILLYFVPVRWLLMAWGINKFTKKLRSPLSNNNNEILDFVSRFPTDKEKQELKEFYLQTASERQSSTLSNKKKLGEALDASLRSARWLEKFQSFKDKFKTRSGKKES